MVTEEKILHKRSKAYIWLVIIGLAISGITAFPIESELAFLVKDDTLPIYFQEWFVQVYNAVKDTNFNYPFLSYGTDWLAFAHLMLALLFIGPLKDPVKNKWVIEFGMICCVLIIPTAIVAGAIRQIPFFWQLVDCSFGVIGFIPLLLCRITIKKIEAYQTKTYSWGL